MFTSIQFVKKHTIAFLIFIISLGLGFAVFGDYGIAWDEPLQRDIGLRSYNYVFHGDNTLNDFKNRDYGVAIELPLIFLEKVFYLNDSRDIYRMRHLTMHLFFLLCAFAFYLLIWILYRNKALAVCGYVMLLLSPKIYAQSFYNSKDIPFMCMFILCFFVSAIAFRDKKLRYFILFGILSGLLINIRIMGIVMPVIISALMLFDVITGPYRRTTLINFLVYLVITIAVAVASWPWLWQDPAGHFRIAFTNMSKFRWDNNILMNGEFVRASAIGWKYLPQWFGLTTPILYLFLGIAGFLFLSIRILRKPSSFLDQSENCNHLLHLACLAGPVMAVILLHSVLYDGWRQMYFIYPSFLLLAVYGLSSLLKMRIVSGDLPKVLVVAILILSFAGTGLTMIKSHPFEDVYFNILLQKKNQYLRKTFELDYWGTSYKQALETIVARDRSPVLYIRVSNLPGENNSLILKADDRKRIRYVISEDSAGYFITNYRWHPGNFRYPDEKKIFSKTIQNSEICAAWKLH